MNLVTLGPDVAKFHSLITWLSLPNQQVHSHVIDGVPRNLGNILNRSPCDAVVTFADTLLIGQLSYFLQCYSESCRHKLLLVLDVEMSFWLHNTDPVQGLERPPVNKVLFYQPFLKDCLLPTLAKMTGCKVPGEPEPLNVAPEGRKIITFREEFSSSHPLFEEFPLTIRLKEMWGLLLNASGEMVPRADLIHAFGSFELAGVYFHNLRRRFNELETGLDECFRTHNGKGFTFIPPFPY